MSINHTKLLSGRAQVVPYANLTADRYQFLALGQAEPNLGPGADNSILTISTDNTRVWSNSITLSSVSVSGNITANGLISATGNITGGNIRTNGLVSATGNISGNFIFGNGSQLTGIITSVSNVVNGGSNLNIATANANVTVSVSTVGNVAVFSPTGVKVSGNMSVSGNVSIANISIVNTTFTSTDSNGNLILFAGSAGIGIPAGNTAQRPVSPTIGVTRFNTITNSIETWDGADWVTSGNSITPGTIVDQQITPDGVSNSYLLVQPSTAAGILVAINGVNQVPTLSYTVTGNTITFSQIPMSSDIIDIRFITYLTSISSLSNSSGNSVVNITPSGNIQFTTANNLFATMTASSFNVNYPVSAAGNVTIGGLLKSPQQTKAANAPGTVGQICWDSNYIYVCTASNTWKRTGLTGGY